MNRPLIVDNKQINTPIEDIIEDLKNSLTNGKLQKVEFHGEDIRVSCPSSNHKGGMETNPSCGVYIGDNPKIEYGTMHCFTCGEVGPFYHFVALCFNRSDDYGKQWLLQHYAYTEVSPLLYLPPIDLPQNNTNKQYLNEKVLDSLQHWHPYLVKRHLSQKVCEQFEVRYDPKIKSIIFPVRDETGKLWMLTHRSIESKNFHIEESKEKPIYLYYYIKQHNIDEVTVCESQINALTLWGWGIPAVALFGTGTKEQYCIINKSSLKHIYLVLDGDEAGDKGTKRFIENVRRDIIIDIIEMIRGKDVNDLTEEEFNKLKIINSNDWMFSYSNKIV